MQTSYDRFDWFHIAGRLVVVALLSLTLAACAGNESTTTGQTTNTAASPALAQLSSLSPTVVHARISASPTVVEQPTTSETPAPGMNGCRSSDLALGAGPPVSEPTGQHTISFTLTNQSSRACSLSGYPTVTLLDATGKTLPFVYRQQGDQVVTSAAPTRFELAPGADAYVTVNKYRCDLGDKASVVDVELRPPSAQAGLSLTLSSMSSVFGYCGVGDPGSNVAVSPFEPTFRATLAERTP